MQVNENPELEKVGEYELDSASEKLLGYIYSFQEQLPIAINQYFADLHGHDPDVRPVGFQVDFKNKKVIALSPKQSRQQRRAGERVADKKANKSGLETSE